MRIQFSLRAAAFAFFALGLVLALCDRYGPLGGSFAIAITVMASTAWACTRGARHGLAVGSTLIAAQPVILAFVLSPQRRLWGNRLYDSLVDAFGLPTLFASGPLGVAISVCSGNDVPRWLDTHLLLLTLASIVQWGCVYYVGLKLLERHKGDPMTPMLPFGLAVLFLLSGSFFFHFVLIVGRHS